MDPQIIILRDDKTVIAVAVKVETAAARGRSGSPEVCLQLSDVADALSSESGAF